MFASKTRARIMHLKERLSLGLALSYELAIINSPLDDVDLVIHTLNGLGTEYREVTAALRTRENPIGFDAPRDVLCDFESYLKRDESMKETPIIAIANMAHKGRQHYNKTGKHAYNQTMPRSTSPGSSRRVMCQFCDKPGHTTKIRITLWLVMAQDIPSLILDLKTREPLLRGQHGSGLCLEDEELMPSNTMSGNDVSTPSLDSTTTITVTTDNSTVPPPLHEPNQIIIRSKNNIFKPKRMYTVSKHPLPENLEPSNIREAMKHAHWRKAIADEFEALIRNGTFSYL
ncbi:hypothetical protein A2U01_0008270 [Trifolium medium]|uniref:Retrovirus-related pol polyprotein from transposon TNT 1-94 n=1 Tax=Trifolium medium TaxID=97028 RepID=A0A392MJ72_9FABA|nr:hypothetical protein [Trifolium medium]